MDKKLQNFFKNNRVVLILMQVILGIFISIIILGSSVFYWSYNESFYLKQHKDNDVIKDLGISQTELEMVTHNLINYLKNIDNKLEVFIEHKIGNVELGEDKDSTLELELSKGYENFYNQREIIHMEDVKRLFIAGQRILIALIISGMILAFVIFKVAGMISISKSLIYAFRFSVVVALVVLIASVVDFTHLFIYFHYMIFDNELWFLDPKTSRLIVMLPEEFFQKIAANILTLWITINLIISAIGKFIISNHNDLNI